MKFNFYANDAFTKPLLLFIGLLFSAATFSQVVINGKIRSGKDSTLLPNVSVSIKGTSTGTITNEDGVFSLSVPDKNAVLVVSSQGYTLQEIAVGNQTILEINLTEDERKLDEVVVVGYGQQRRRDITGAISSVSQKALSEVPVNSPAQALQGRVAGLYAVSGGYRPGSDVTIRIRGNRSFSADNDPLFVVDGIPITGGLNDINPNEIESMEVLKDASATAIYGSRGANGVIIITTKRGKSGKPLVSYDAYYGIVQSLGKAELFNGAEFTEYKRESRRTTNRYNDNNRDSSDRRIFDPVELASIAGGRSTDYQDLVLQNGSQQSHQLGLSGGNETTRYNMSLGYFSDKGVISIQDFTRYTLRINLDQQVSKRIRVGSSILTTSSLRNGFNVNVFGNSLPENPLGIPFDSSGKMIFLPTNDGLRSNPVADLVEGANIDRNKRLRVLGSLYGEVDITRGLKYRINFGPDVVHNRNGRFLGRQTSTRRLADPVAFNRQDFVMNYTLENIVTYNKTFKKVHTLGLTGLYSVQTREQEGNNDSVRGVAIERMEYYNLASAPIIDGVGSFYEKWTILSYMARLNYGYDGRYLLTLTGRADGSSRFAPGNKWGIFPSIAVGWNISNEAFLSGSKLVSNLKLRASYGETGNTGINPYQTLGGLNRTTYAFENTSAYGYRPGSIPNPNLKWETTASGNIGLDFGLLNNRFTGSVEVYQQNTQDLLMPRQLPFTSGYGNVLENVGATRNTGYEVTLSSMNIESKKKDGFTWTTDLNFAHNKEEIVELYGGTKDDIGNRWFIGQPIRVFYDFEKIGIWQTADKDLAASFSQRPGQIRIKDQNGDGKINAADNVILGTDVPDLSGGITNRITYKGFDLSVFVFARFGSTIISQFHEDQNTLFGRYNNLKVDYWTPANPTNAYPRPDENTERPLYNTTLRYFDGSFVKIRSINLGYNLPEALSQKARMQSARVYVTLLQPAIFASYRQEHKGIDPEYPLSNTPATAMYSLGINVKF